MNVVSSEEAVLAFVVLETQLAARYSVSKAAEIIDSLVHRVDRLQAHPQLGRVVPEYGHWPAARVGRQMESCAVAATTAGHRDRHDSAGTRSAGHGRS